MLKPDAYTLDAVIEAGVPPSTARMLLADGPRAVPERALVSASGRARTDEPTTRYVWWPDAVLLLADMVEREKLCRACLARVESCACGREEK